MIKFILNSLIVKLRLFFIVYFICLEFNIMRFFFISFCLFEGCIKLKIWKFIEFSYFGNYETK